MIAALVVYVLLGGGWAWYALREDEKKVEEVLSAVRERHGEHADKWVLAGLTFYFIFLWPISVYVRYIGIGKP